MRIVDRATFLAMPPGTVFAKYEPTGITTDLGIMEGAMGEDFVEQPLSLFWFEGHTDDSGTHMAALCAMEANPDMSLPVTFDFAGRDGCFDQDQRFAVFEPHDLDALIARLIEARAALAEGKAP